jgi:magnesium-protoporphyrin O-methyltransferase
LEDRSQPEDRCAADCCTADFDPRIPRHFDKDMTGHLEAGTFPPLAETSRGLLELLSDVDQVKPTILELGSGSGGLSVALLERGAERADGVDLSPASVDVARRRAAEAGVSERATFSVGNGAEVDLEQHDWVVLDRVICCYAHVERLLTNSIAAARARYVISVPVSSGWRSLITKSISFLENATNRLRGRPCPGYVHPVPLIERRLADAGFRRLRYARVGLWHTAVYERQSAGL